MLPNILTPFCGFFAVTYAKQKHLGCKKVQGQEEPAIKSSDIK